MSDTKSKEDKLWGGAEARMAYEEVWAAPGEISPIFDFRKLGELKWEDFLDVLPTAIMDRGYGTRARGAHFPWQLYWKCFLGAVFYGWRLADLKNMQKKGEFGTRTVSLKQLEDWWNGRVPAGSTRWEFAILEIHRKLLTRESEGQLTLSSPYTLAQVEIERARIEKALPKEQAEADRVFSTLQSMAPSDRGYGTLQKTYASMCKELERRSGLEDHRKFMHHVAKAELDKKNSPQIEEESSNASRWKGAGVVVDVDRL